MRTQRNDRCPCGSGRKFKKCCQGKQTQWQRPELSREPVADSFDEGLFDGGLPSPEELASPEYWDNLMRKLPDAYRRELAPIIEQGRQIAEYQARAAEIEAAEEALEPFRDEYEKFMRDKKSHERARRLFEEEIFAPMRFHAADFQRAFDAVGFPVGNNEEIGEILDKALHFLVDDLVRLDLATRLISLLPDFVKAGRHIDACIVRHCAVVLQEAPESLPGPFVLVMFEHGLKEWEKHSDREQRKVLDALGLPADAKLKELGLERADELLQELTQDPKKAAALERLLDDHPEMRALAEAQARETEKAAIDLLKRDDARQVLLLTWEQMEPWIPMIEQRLVDSGLKLTQSKPSKATIQKFSDTFYDATAEMAGEFWTSSRLKELRSRILQYRRTLKSEDRRGIIGVTGVLTAVGSTAPPEENYFLTALCWESVRTLAANGPGPGSQAGSGLSSIAD